MRGKKGDQTAFIVTLVLLLGISIMAYLMADKSSKYDSISKGKTIGERQFEMFSAYAEGEKALNYVDLSSKIAIEKAEEELAKKGGYSTTSECGRYSGFTLWTNGGKDCIPGAEEVAKNHYKILTRNLNQYYTNYKNNEIPSEYTFSINKGYLTGTAKDEIKITKGKKDTFVYKVKPSFKQKFDTDFTVYKDMAEKAKEIIETCKSIIDFADCATKFNSQTLEIGCGEQPENGKPVKVCAKANGVEYRFALSKETVPASANEIETIKQMAYKHGVPAEIALKVAAVESGYTFEHYDYDGNAKKGDGGCSVGIMQINTCAHKQCQGALNYNPFFTNICTGTESCLGKTIEDMECNIEAGIMYLKQGYQDFQEKERQGKAEESKCSCSGKYQKWDYALRYYNGCECNNNNYVEIAKNADVNEYLT